MREYEEEILDKIKDYYLFNDIYDSKDVLGEFVDKLLDKSLYMYRNR